MNYEVMLDKSVRIYHKCHFVRIWLDKVEVDNIEIDININELQPYDDIAEIAVNYFEKEILKNDNVA